MSDSANLGVMAQMQLEDPIFSEILWKMTPTSLAVRLSQGQYKTWNYIQLLSRKLVDVAMGRCPRLIVCLPPRHGKPVDENAPVLLGSGLRVPLAYVEVGDEVITHLNRIRRVLAVYVQGKLQCVTMKTKTGREVTAALDHPFLTERGWVLAGDISLGQFLCLNKLFEVSTGHTRHDAAFRLYGYFIGDGCSTSGASNIFASDKEELSDISSCAKELGLGTWIDGPVCHFLDSRPWLKDVGLWGKGSHDKSIAPWVFSAPNMQIAQFLGAYFATDGSVSDAETVRLSGERAGSSTGCAIEYCSVNRGLLEDTSHLLLRFGIRSNLREKLGKYKGERHHSWRLIITERDSINVFVEKIPVFHELKRKKLAAWVVALDSVVSKSPRLSIQQIDSIKKSNKTFRELSEEHGVGDHVIWNVRKGIGKNEPRSEEYFYDEVVSLSSTTAQCRCLTVEEDETFTANDFVVHNSFLVSQWFPVWYLENFPERKIILASYEADFAARWGGKVRDIIIQNQEMLNVRMKVKNPAQHYFETSEDGSMACAGVGGPLTGKGANLLIIDDYVKNPSAKCDWVLTSDGSSKTLGSLEVGDMVVTHAGRSRRVAEIFERGFLDCVRITTFSGRALTVALSHPCLTLLGWEQGGDLEVGDRLCIPKMYQLETSTSRKVEEFRLAGYIVGDGCCNKQVAMAVTDSEEKEDFEACALATGLRTTKPGKSRDAGALHVSGGIPWAQNAEMHGKVAATKVVPSWVFTSPNEHVANFIGAYFATDGCVTSPIAYAEGLVAHKRGGKLKNGAVVQFDSVSRELLCGLQLLLSRFSIYSRLRPSRTHYKGAWTSFWTLYITDSASVKLFAEKIPVHHSMKRVKLRGWLEYLNIRPAQTSVEVLRDIAEGRIPTGVSINALDNLRRGLSSGDNYSPIGNDYVYDRIVSIEPCVEDCRCIAVEDDHSFLANGLVVHNSEEANSLTMREKTWDWWTSTARTRIEPFMDPKTRQKVQPAVIVMATRWNADDLIGRLINPQFSNDSGEREQWEVFVFPALAEAEAEQHYRQFDVTVNDLRMGSLSGAASVAHAKSLREQLSEAENPEWRDILGRKRGEPLCPDRFNERDLALFRGSSLRDWYSLYQQRPGDEADDGNVYHCFDERKHCKPLHRDETMQLFVSLDFNVNPGSIVIGQYDRGVGYRLMNRCEILEEIVIPNSNTMDMMARLLMELKKYQWGYTLEIEVYGDAAGTQRSSQSQKSNWQIVAEYFGMDTSIHYRFLRKKANPMIVDRVNAVNTMLQSADGTVRLYVDDVKCPELIKDFKKVKWQTDSAGSSSGLLDKSDAKRTHISDALGYALEYLFALKGRSGGRKGVLQ